MEFELDIDWIIAGVAEAKVVGSVIVAGKAGYHGIQISFQVKGRIFIAHPEEKRVLIPILLSSIKGQGLWRGENGKERIIG